MALAPWRSLKVPIALAAVTVALSIALLVGWTLLVLENVELSQQVGSNTWLLIGGNLAFIIIMTVLVLFGFFQAREILQGRRQVSFIDSVTHELKSPLASLKLSVQTLQRRHLAEAQRAQVHQIMIDDLDRLSAFIDDVLEASRLDSGASEHVMTEVALVALVERCAERVRRRYRVEEEAIRIVAPPELSLVSDPTSLEIILRNILDNAVKYSDEPVQVEVTLQAEGRDRVRVEVQDRGIGVPKEHLRRIFNRFYRVPSESVRSRRGTGLGLFVVSQLTRNLGGRLTATSEGKGLGTTMTILLPSGRRSGRGAASMAMEEEGA